MIYEKMLKAELITELEERDENKHQLEINLQGFLENIMEENCGEASPYIKRLQEILGINLQTTSAVELQIDAKIPIYLAKVESSTSILDENKISLLINGEEYPVSYYGIYEH